MADFTTMTMDCNTGTLGTPTWTGIATGGSSGANEIRWSDVGTGLLSTSYASWPAMIRPAATSAVSYTYAFTADTTGLGFIGGASDPPAFANSNYKWARWSWDNTGTFASAPIYTAYASTAHGAITPGDGSMLGGNSTDSSSRSYLKINAYGANTATMPSIPTGAPSNVPLVTSGTTGVLTFSGSAAWLTNYQDAQGDTDYIQYGATPTATSAQVWYIIFALFTGPNETPATYTSVQSLKYTWT